MHGKDITLYNLINNKRVVIVGPAGYLSELKLGKHIDSYDVVVKINNMLNLTDVINYGKKIDILATNLQFIRENKLTDKLLLDKGVKYIISKKIFDVNTKIKFSLFTKIFSDVFKSYSPLSGIYAINEILLNKPKELRILGFDFYTSKKRYADNYRSNKINLIGWNMTSTDKGSDPPHNIYGDLKYLIDLIDNNKNITIDSVLKNIIKNVKHN